MLFFSLNSPDQFLYHYTHSDIAIQKILPTQRLRMGAFLTTNDPRESKEWIFGFGTNANFSGVSGAEFSRLEKEATKMAKGTVKLICFTLDSKEAVGVGIDKIYHRGFCRPRMWAQYASHSGVCLILDKPKIKHALLPTVENQEFLFEGNVQYKNRSQVPTLENNPFILNFDRIRSNGMEAAVRWHIKRFWRDLFFEKAVDWADEKEFRWVVWDTRHEHHFFNYGNALKGIVIGSDFDESLMPRMFEFQQQHGYELGQLNWKNGVPEILPRFQPTK